MRRRSPTLLLIFLTVLSIPARLSFGWIATGHIVISMICWEDLTPKSRAAVTAMLKQHPRYEKDLLQDLPADSTADETDRFAFAKGSTWPDMVRAPENPMHTLYNHPAWHFIDIPYLNGVTTSPTTQYSAGPGPQNIVEALRNCITEMKDPAVAAAERAIDICWVEHLVGDIHQPLHAASMYSRDYPQGDKGGADEEVLRDPPFPNSRQNLHFVWDALPGDFHSQLMDRFEALGLRADPKYSREKFKEQLDAKDFMTWANESHQLAVDDVYLNGHLETAAVHRGAQNGAAGGVPGLPPDYLEKAERVAMNRIALAGYRLADLLNEAFDPKH